MASFSERSSRFRSIANAPGSARFRKRLADLVLAAVGLVVAIPLVIAIAVLIRLDSRGPALFFQRRIGRGERVFTLVKLRTMDQRGRCTRLGRVLRPSGLDELPQLWNVLCGTMSLIGPRPEVPDRVARYRRAFANYRDRHSIRPGMTGWAQINGLRGNVSIAERLRFDLEYVRNWTPAMDRRILRSTLETIWNDTVHSLRGAREQADK